MGEIRLNFGRWHPHILELVRPTIHLLTHSRSVILSKNSMEKNWINKTYIQKVNILDIGPLYSL